MADKKKTPRPMVARQPPPMKHRSTKRDRDRSSQNRNSINRSFRGE